MRARTIVLAATACCAFVAWMAVRRPMAVGDSGEYLLMLQALASHGTPDIRAQDVPRLAAAAAGHGIDGAFGGLRDGIRPSRSGRAYAIHFWLYPATALPARFALGVLGLNTLAAFQVTNALLLSAAVLVVLRLAPADMRLPWAVLTAAGPAFWYTPWPHPEVFTFALATSGLAAAVAGRWTWAAAGFALGGAQNPPLAPIAVACALVAVRLQVPWWKAAAALAPAAAPPIFYLATLGVPSPVLQTSASLEAASLGKALDLVVDLDVGLLPYAPAVVLLAAVGVFAAGGRRRAVALASWAGLVGAAWLASAALSWNSASSGPARYAVWLYPFLAAAAVQVAPTRSGRALLSLAVAVQVGIAASRLPDLGAPDDDRHSAVARLVLDRWPHLYAPHEQVWRARTSPARPGGPHVWRRADGSCAKALAQKRHVAELVHLCGDLPRDARFPARDHRGQREAWRYVVFPAPASSRAATW